MTQDLGALLLWIRIVATITSICVTAVPIVFAFAPWRSRLIGRLFMLQSVAFALVFDVRTLFFFWMPKEAYIRFWINAVSLTIAAFASVCLAGLIGHLIFFGKAKIHDSR